MHQLMFVNLPVQDLERSRTFFTEVGYSFNTDFCDASALCLELGPTLHAMLLDRDAFASFHDSTVAEPGTVEALLCLSAASRQAVDAVVDRAVAAGGTDIRRVDHGMMYGRTYADLDGHVWEVMWMDRDAATRETA